MSRKKKYQKSRKAKKRKPEVKSRKLLRTILGLALLSIFTLISIVFFNPWVWRLDLRAELEKSKIASAVYDRKGLQIASLYSKTRLWVRLDDMPLSLRQAYIATEDARFYLHKGIDIRGIGRAIYEDIKSGRKVQGGSTITQQLVKNLFFSQEKNFLRKVMEMAYAIRIEQQYSKDQILELYLNSIYLGHGAWGVEAASRVYFGKSVQEITLEEAALLAGLAKSPEYYSPFRNPKAALQRRNIILKLMKKYGYISASQEKRSKLIPVIVLNTPGSTYLGAYFVDYILDYLLQETKFSEQYLRTAGLKVYTTMDRDIQKEAEQIISNLPFESQDRWGVKQPQGALVIVNPKNGEVLGIVGGRRFSGAEKNRSYQLHRQPGSAIKPFVYATAIENGYKLESQMNDQPLEIEVNGQIWKPQNYDGKYLGWISLQTALEESVNTVSVELVRQLGVKKVFALAQKMGIESLIPEGTINDMGLAPLALGGLTRGVTLLELTGAYTAFANQGIRSRPFGIIEVHNHNGATIFRSSIKQEQVISYETAVALTTMMEGVVERGTGQRAKISVRTAGKTGTTNGNTNGWFIGYTDNLLAGVWIGNDQPNQPLIVNGIPMGSGMAASMWSEFMRRVL